MNLDKFTFGSRPGMVNLTDILNKLNDKKITRKCGYLISSFCFKMCYCKTHSRAVTLEVLQFYKKKYLLSRQSQKKSGRKYKIVLLSFIL